MRPHHYFVEVNAEGKCIGYLRAAPYRGANARAATANALGWRREHAARVWAAFGALSCVVNAFVAGWYQGASAYGNEDWPQIAKDWDPDYDTVQK